jgi:hypothetical protein
LILVLVIEKLENGFLILLIDAESFVVHDEDQLLLVPIVGEVDVYLAILAVLDCILNDVHAHLLDSIWVSNRTLWQIVASLL